MPRGSDRDPVCKVAVDIHFKHWILAFAGMTDGEICLASTAVVLTIGTFDGVHRGHQRLLAVARRRAHALNGAVLAVAFERPPRLFFSPLPCPTLLTTPTEKEDLLRRYGADRVETIPFSKDVAKQTADQ